MDIQKLQKNYSLIKSEIFQRLAEFKKLWQNSTDEQIFTELCFCLCTPQTKAVNADKAIKSLLKDNILFTGTAEEISKYLKGLVRFHNNKSKYIVEAREFFFSPHAIKKIKQTIDSQNIKATRLFFFKNIKGLGLKEASHFLRNIGFGEELAILDRHILKNLCLLKVIDEVPKNLDTKTYFLVEQKIEKFSLQVNIPMDYLDFILWQNETGKIFK
jgi:N-glycosylase/DNA lyase